MEKDIKMSSNNEDKLQNESNNAISILLQNIKASIEKHHSSSGKTPVNFIDNELDTEIKTILEDLNKKWFAYGFYTGHVHAFTDFNKNNKVSIQYKRKLERRFGYDANKSSVRVTSHAHILI